MTASRTSSGTGGWRIVGFGAVALFIIAASGAARAQSTIVVDPLPEVRTDTIGIIEPSEGGLAPDLWQHSDGAVVESVFARVSATSPHARSLLRRLALSVAHPPQHDSMGARLLAARADLLWRIGDGDGMDQLIAAAPRAAASDGLRRLETERSFLAGNEEEACTAVEGEITGSAAEYWQRAAIACQALAGARAKAELGLALLHELGEPVGSDFSQLVSAVLTDAPGGPAAAVDWAYEFALARRVKAPLSLPAGPVNLSLLAAMADAPWLSEAERIAAAQTLAAFGGLRDPLLALYGDAPPADSKDTKPLPAAPAEEAAWPRPKPRPNPAAGADQDASTAKAHYQAVVAAETPANRARALAAALAAGWEDGTPIVTAHLYEPWLIELTPGAETGDAGPAIARALLVLGDVEGAQAWLATADPGTDDAAPAELSTRLAALASVLDLPDEQPAPLPFDANALVAGASTAKDRALLFGVADALGHRVPAQLWLALLDDEGVTAAASIPIIDRRLLENAADEGRRGELILLALGLLAPPAGTDPSTDEDALVTTVRSLSAAGLPGEAGLLAAEALAARL